MLASIISDFGDAIDFIFVSPEPAVRSCRMKSIASPKSLTKLASSAVMPLPSATG